MIGVLANVFAVIIGSTIGMIMGRGIPKRLTDAVMTGVSLCVIYIGIDGMLEGQNTLVCIISIVLGAIVGTLLDCDGRINALGDWVAGRFKAAEGETSVAQGFVTASLLFCVGALAIVGPLNSGISGDNSILFTKSLLDGISSIMLTVSLGFGVILSSVFVLIFQGSIYLLAGVLAPMLTDGAIAEMTCVGSLLILALGLNMLGITKIKISDYTPAIFFAPIVYTIYSLIG